MSYFNRGLLGVTMPNFLLGNSGKSTMRKEENVYQETHNPAEVKEHACGPAELKVCWRKKLGSSGRGAFPNFIRQVGPTRPLYLLYIPITVCVMASLHVFRLSTYSSLTPPLLPGQILYPFIFVYNAIKH